MIHKNGVPNNWMSVKLSEVCKRIVGGGTPSTIVERYWKGKIDWITSADILGLKDVRPRKKITKEAIENSATNLLPKGGIIVVTRVSLGKLAIAPNDLCFSQDSHGLVLNESMISQQYALWCLSRAVQRFKHEYRGTTIKGVTKKQLVELEIPLPPLPEQHRIVEKIEALFSELENGIEQLKIAQQQLKVYRQSVLKWAFEGKLTEEWREGQKAKGKSHNAKELLEHIKQEREQQAKASGKKLKPIAPLTDKELAELSELPEGWMWVKAGTLAGQITDGEHATPQRSAMGVLLLSARNVQNGFLALDNVDYIPEEEYKKISKRLTIEGGDVLLSCSGSVDRSCVAPDKLRFSLVRSIAVIKPYFAMGKYLSLTLRSPHLQAQILEKQTQTAQANIFQGKIRELIVPIAPLAEQSELVAEIESRLSVCDKLEETITASLQQSEALRQSILKKAFEGKL